MSTMMMVRTMTAAAPKPKMYSTYKVQSNLIASFVLRPFCQVKLATPYLISFQAQAGVTIGLEHKRPIGSKANKEVKPTFLAYGMCLRLLYQDEKS